MSERSHTTTWRIMSTVLSPEKVRMRERSEVGKEPSGRLRIHFRTLRRRRMTSELRLSRKPRAIPGNPQPKVRLNATKET